MACVCPFIKFQLLTANNLIAISGIAYWRIDSPAAKASGLLLCDLRAAFPYCRMPADTPSALAF
jgi:hypothetical protein